jgi:pre-mRNA-splicing factor ATP-dependent RNA helicase DHX16
MRQIIEIENSWLVEVAPHYYKEKDIEDAAAANAKKLPRGQGLASQHAGGPEA